MSGFSGTNRNLEGTRLHQKLQKAEKEGYEKELTFQKTVTVNERIQIRIEGRADGIYSLPDGRRAVDEIKSTVVSLERLHEDMFPLHWAQAKCYAYMLAEQETLEEVTVRLSYIHVETEEVRYFYRAYTAQELEAFWNDLIERYQEWVLWKDEWDALRQQSLAGLTFPFPQFRPGQRTMAAYIFRAIKERERVFLQAPTGIGKTISSLFPALKAMGTGQTEKVFYLTAKNVTAGAALQALQLLRQEEMQKGRTLRLKSLQLVAKDKICLQEKRECDPHKCPYAMGHYDRVNEAVLEALRSLDHLEKEQLQKLAQEHKVCPFELALDIATWVDVIVCDYNYAFDPTASLKRFFQDNKKQDYVLLVDEAHNLVDRAREMYSADLNKRAFLDFRAQLDKSSALYKRCSKINTLFLEMKKGLKKDQRFLPAEPEEKWYAALKRFSEKMEEHLVLLARSGGIPDDVFELYFRVLFFIKIWDQKGAGYETYLRRLGRDLQLKFFCVDPSEPLKAVYDKVRSVVFFSATLMPVQYYKELLGGQAEEKTIALPSPFDARRKCVMVGRVRATYQGREYSLDSVCDMLHAMTQAKAGHYMAFFPSFVYMNLVQERYAERFPEETLLVQESQMDEEERQAFLQRFETDSGALLGFCVLGGVFSEGIDLRGQRLIGTAIVSVGIPQLGLERDLIKEHVDKASGQGFEYAYMYPGIGKVFQAAGRVIRTEQDAGVVLLLDERFDQQRYYQLYPPDWFPVTRVQPETIAGVLADFWKNLEPGEEKPRQQE